MFGLVMAFDFAFQAVNRAAVRAFDGAVGLNRQENTRMAVPRFVFRAGAVQGQVVRGDNDSGVLVAHRVSFFIIWCGRQPPMRAGGWISAVESIADMVRHACLILKCRKRIITLNRAFYRQTVSKYRYIGELRLIWPSLFQAV